jgi:hypothetical protein
LVERAIESGDVRPDLDPLDLLRALVGVSNVAPGPDWAQSAKRLVDILILGSRPIAASNSSNERAVRTRRAPRSASCSE